MELLTPYSLSRGAPSATRPSLQICARRSNGPADHVGERDYSGPCPSPLRGRRQRRRSATAVGCLVSHSAISPNLCSALQWSCGPCRGARLFGTLSLTPSGPSPEATFCDSRWLSCQPLGHLSKSVLGAPMVLRTMSGSAIIRDFVPHPFGAVARGDVLRQPLAVLSATRPSLQICARRSNGPADHVGERDYSGLRPSPLRGCRRVNPTSASRAILRAKRHLATSRQPEIVNRVMLQDQHRCWPWSMHRARRPQSVRHSNFINPTYQSSACPFSRLIRS